MPGEAWCNLRTHNSRCENGAKKISYFYDIQMVAGVYYYPSGCTGCGRVSESRQFTVCLEEKGFISRCARSLRAKAHFGRRFGIVHLILSPATLLANWSTINSSSSLASGCFVSPQKPRGSWRSCHFASLGIQNGSFPVVGPKELFWH